jgi:large subunit ribosomal protein L6
MSRIGKQPVPVPGGVTVTLDKSTLTVKGPRGELTRTFHPEMLITFANGELKVDRPSEETRHKALHGLSRTLMANMVEGVTKGYIRQLEITGVGYKAEVKPYGLLMSLGFSHTIQVKAPPGISHKAPVPTQVVVEGADKEVVGRIASEIRKLRKPEPYKGKGVRYAGEIVRRKAGKAGGK